MSGPDERRGTGGGDVPLDVDAAFADIVAHFHDGEPAPPRVVEGPADAGPAGAAVQDLGPAPADALTQDPSDGADAREDPGPDAGADEAATDWALRYERAAREELAAHEERLARAEREARISAEVDRAVGADHRFVPDEPPPMPRLDLQARLAWGAVLLGPLTLVLFALLWPDAAPWLVGTVVTAIVAGFGYLVWRLPSNRDHDDDGAIV